MEFKVHGLTGASKASARCMLMVATLVPGCGDPGDILERDCPSDRGQHASGFDQLVEAAGGGPPYVSLLDHRRKRLLGGSSRLEKAGKYEPFLSFGTLSSTVPARASQSRSRKPLR
jgi:hypothetical protein